MNINRKEHYQFLEDELRAQTEQFSQKLSTSATYLREVKGELFAAQYLKFENGEMILKFSNRYSVPRKGEYLYCFTVPKELRNPHNWEKKTYGDLIKSKGCFSEVVCIWQSPIKDNPDFCLSGFRGVDTDFANCIMGGEGMILLLGPNKPPYEYISNLQNIVQTYHNTKIDAILDCETSLSLFEPFLLESKIDISNYLLTQLSLSDSIILQGPPGTGKTYQIAELCKKLCQQGNSVLVTALTNRALMEVASKESLNELLLNGNIHKTKLTVDETKEIPDLQNIKQLSAIPGHIILSTFYITSGEATKVASIPPFDVVIMDEASQALLGMFVASILLGKKCIYVGDPEQLSPVITINEDRIARRNYSAYIDGLTTICDIANIPAYRLIETYRLPYRAATYTGIFYNNTLKSKANTKINLLFPDLLDDLSALLNNSGGPTLLKTDLPLGDKKPIPALALSTIIVSSLLCIKEKLSIAVLSSYVETAKALQRTIYQTVGNHNNLLIDTVSRIQGLTTDIVIFVIPNTGYDWSLNRRLFNVATSRARRHTIIIADKNILSFNSPLIDSEVKTYLQKLNDEQSVYVPTNDNNKIIRNQTITASSSVNSQIENEQTIDLTHSSYKALPAYDNPNFIETEVPKMGVKVVGFIDLEKTQSKKRKNPSTKTVYIIDTNVFVDCPDICNKLGKDNQIILSAKVVDELDKLKITLSEEEKENVNKALKNLNQAIDQPNVTFEVANTKLLPPDFNRRSPDNMILSVALKYKSDNPILLTSDNGLQIKAKGMHITTISLKELLKF